MSPKKQICSLCLSQIIGAPLLGWRLKSYYNLSSVCGRVCPETTPPFRGRQAPNLARRLGSDTKKKPNSFLCQYDHSIIYHQFVCALESGQVPNWQGASRDNRGKFTHSLNRKTVS